MSIDLKVSFIYYFLIVIDITIIIIIIADEGTPVQNNLPELFSLFDFVCPGLLGRDQQQFDLTYGKVISMGLIDRDANSYELRNSKQKLEALKKKYEPFFLRRLKKDYIIDNAKNNNNYDKYQNIIRWGSKA